MEDKPKPRAKSLRTRIMEGLLLVFLLLIGWAILIPTGGGRAKQNARRSACQSNLKKIMLGVKQYIQDYDEKYPCAVSGGSGNSGKTTDYSAFGWADALQPYLKSTQILQCPSEEKPADRFLDPLQLQYTDYWFNFRASNADERQFFEPMRTVTLGDGDSDNARYHLAQIPQNWRGNAKSPLYRHLDGANYAFADGHVKWFRWSHWKTELDMDNGPTFRLKPTN